MAFKPNYQQQRGDRNRAKEAKKQEKLRIREEETARRRAAAEQDKTESGNAPAEQKAPSAEGDDFGQA
jgi:hypothetical protein